MKLISYCTSRKEARAGMLIGGKPFDVSDSARAVGKKLPTTMLELISGGSDAMSVAREVERAILGGGKGSPADCQKLLAPVPNPPTCRDGYAFRQHVAAMRRTRGLEMVPEFDQFPVFYFMNHHAIAGEGEVVVEEDHLQRLDFELELAIVIGRRGRNIRSDQADDYIAGFTIMNDLSARFLQSEEMKLSLGPAKGKDFSTTIGPWFVTPDELERYRIPGPHGSSWALEMKAWHNGKQISSGNAKDMNWSFAEIIERAAYGCDLFPGDVIGSGTVGTGCYAELNAVGEMRAKEKGESFTPTWFKAGDTIALEITGLGKLTNTFVQAPERYSILARRKNV